MNLKFDTDVKNGTNILDVDIPAQLEKYCSTGMPFIDDAFGGKGMTPSTVVMLTGTPGAGKTTLMMQLADSLSRKGHLSIFNTAEESLFQVRRVAKRLRLKKGFMCGSERMVPEIIKNTDELRKKYPKKQAFIIIDSLQTIDDGKYGNGATNSMSQVRALEALTQYAKETYTIVIVIGQVTKSGDLAGKQTLKHIVDAHCHLFVDLDRKSDSYGERCFEVKKNRFGCAGISYVLSMGERGFREAF